MATVTIDGRTLSFAPGETIIQVADRSHVEIPYYCWHPRLSEDWWAFARLTYVYLKTATLVLRPPA